MPNKIKTFSDPSIELDEIYIDDTEKGTNDQGTEDPAYQLSKVYGFTSPLIQINGILFAEKMIMSCRITMEGMLPKISCVLYEMGGIFSSKHYPKDGDMLNVYIQSKNDDYKTVVRSDFRVISVSAPPSRDSQGENNFISLEGLLHIPLFFSEVAQSYRESTSHAALRKIADEFSLGFQSNIDDTADSMNWVCPTHSKKRFIQEDLSLHSYANDDSFFTVFVDQHYYVNMIEVNDRFTIEEDFKEVTAHILSTDDTEIEKGEVAKSSMLEVLTNSNYAKDTPYFIEGYTPFNNTGQISLKNAYRRYLQTYDKQNREFLRYFIETLNTEGSDGSIILKDRVGVDHTAFRKFNYTGMQATVNVHENYHHAAVQNFINNVEVTKMGLVVRLPYVNPAIHRYMSIPVVILNKGNPLRRSLTQSDQPETEDVSRDEFLSGWYVVHSYEYIYSGATKRFTQEITLIRREWNEPVK